MPTNVPSSVGGLKINTHVYSQKCQELSGRSIREHRRGTSCVLGVDVAQKAGLGLQWRLTISLLSAGEMDGYGGVVRSASPHLPFWADGQLFLHSF